MNRSYAQLILLPLSAMAAGLLVYISILDLFAPSGGVEVTGFLTGIAVMWFLDLSTGVVFKSQKEASHAVIDVTPALQDVSLKLIESEIKSEPSYNATARQLLDVDPALALAQIRIEIERTLRDIYESSDLPRVPSWRGIKKAIDVLVEHQRIPAMVRVPLEQVVSICNRAVHGGEVSRELAIDVIESGERILGILHDARREMERTP
jgi:hypothetical protein